MGRKTTFALLFIIGLLLAFAAGFFKGETKKDQSGFKKQITLFSKSTTLQEVVDKAMAGSSGRYGIVIKNLKTGENFSFNEHQAFDPGSLYKLWVMATALQQIADGLLHDDDILSQDAAVLNEEFEIPAEDAELTEGTIEMTVNDALEQMITISHNYAAFLLSEKMKISTIAKFMEDSGFHESGLESSLQTTAFDIALFYEKLYQGQLANPASSQRMLDILSKQTLNDGLPKYLPANTRVAHKTGDLGYFKHDGGIIYSSQGDYIIVVLSESDSPASVQERIAQLSKAVFDYFNQNR